MPTKGEDFKYVFVEYPDPFDSEDFIRDKNGILQPVSSIERREVFLATEETVWGLMSDATEKERPFKVYRLGACIAAGDGPNQNG